jgi:disease resistance protein RPM1
LFNLRFLGLRKTGIEILPEAVGRLQNIEVLDAFGTALLSVPKDVAKLKKIRCLYACTLLIEGTLKLYRGIEVPRGIGNLTGLHALQDVKASLDTLLCEVAALTELRTFSVSDVKIEQSSNLCRAIMNMRHLVHLSIVASNENEILPLEALSLPPTLSKLELEGQMEKKQMSRIVSLCSNLDNLTRLHLRFSKIDEESFSSLKMLHSLCYLSLSKAYDGKKLYFPAESFPRLR